MKWDFWHIVLAAILVVVAVILILKIVGAILSAISALVVAVLWIAVIAGIGYLLYRAFVPHHKQP
jgi:Iron-containing outer mitochondrial membrane protein N-terminus